MILINLFYLLFSGMISKYLGIRPDHLAAKDEFFLQNAIEPTYLCVVEFHLVDQDLFTQDGEILLRQTLVAN